MSGAQLQNMDEERLGELGMVSEEDRRLVLQNLERIRAGNVNLLLQAIQMLEDEEVELRRKEMESGTEKQTVEKSN